mmetsp:Transcript_16540/g.57827  ORF Transcript_16540/g.57827 Transcript_16540/m.57827 type:complete len:162 (+) Transcript_16540:236-721(+)
MTASADRDGDGAVCVYACACKHWCSTWTMHCRAQMLPSRCHCAWLAASHTPTHRLQASRPMPAVSLAAPTPRRARSGPADANAAAAIPTLNQYHSRAAAHRSPSAAAVVAVRLGGVRAGGHHECVCREAGVQRDRRQRTAGIVGPATVAQRDVEVRRCTPA